MIRHRCTGIDISGSYFDVSVRVDRRLHDRRFAQGLDGFESLLGWLDEIKAGHCWFGMEHTGGYEQALATFLIGKGHRVSLLDGMKVHAFKISEGKKSNTDKGAARMIAKFVSQKKPALWTPRPDAFNELLQLKKHRDSLVADITVWKNRRSAPGTNSFVNEQENALIEVLKLQLRAVEEEIQKCVVADPEIRRSAQRIVTLKGVALTTAAAFLAESGPITRKSYPKPDNLALAAGLPPIPNMSGTSKKGTYTKPYGNANLRNCLNLAAVNAKRHDPAMALFAQRMERRGKCKAVQNRAIKRKLVHIIWALVVNDEDYQPEKAIWRFPSKEG